MTEQAPSGSSCGDALFLEAAREYAARDWPVLPVHSVHDGRCSCGARECKSAGKHPRTARGYRDATTDKAVIERIWQGSPANIGIRTGAASRLAVLDVDPRNDGNQTLAELERRFGPLPPTLTAETGGGGRHLYFDYPGGESSKSHTLGPGLELKLNGAYVIAPPSIHRSGQSYRFTVPAVALAPLPPWLAVYRQSASRRASTGGHHSPPAEPIREGNRSTRLASLAGSMRRSGSSRETIAIALLGENRLRCSPPLEEAEVRGIAQSISQYPTREGRLDKRTQGDAGLLVQLTDAVEFFHTPDSRPWATIPAGAHRETWELSSQHFMSWLAHQFYQTRQTAPSKHAMEAALGVFRGKALHEGPVIPVFTRVGKLGETIYLDLGNDAWQAVEISPKGWRVIDAPPVKFRRPKGQLPLPVPVQGGDLSLLRRLLNLPDETSWVLVVGWLVAAFRPTGPYPILALFGEQGSAKSMCVRLLRSLVDPAIPQLRSELRDVRDLMIAANNVHALAFDNLSYVPPALADALCRLSTGGGYATRQLYSDTEETIFDLQRPVILNGIEEPVTRADLLDRSLLVRLPSIPEERRRLEAEVLREFEAARAGILGALLDDVAGALRDLPFTELPLRPRMADFALWVTAAEASLGWSPGTFMRAYQGNRETANDLALDSSPVVRSILQLADRGGPWTGSMGELLSRLRVEAAGVDVIDKLWPRSARALRSVLDRLRPNLRAIGVGITFLPRGRDGRMVRIETTAAGRSQPSQPSHDEASDSEDVTSQRESDDGGSDGHSEGAETDTQPSHASNSANATSDGRDGCDGCDGPTASPLMQEEGANDGEDLNACSIKQLQPFETPHELVGKDFNERDCS